MILLSTYAPAKVMSGSTRKVISQLGKLDKICSKLGGGVNITVVPSLEICKHMLKATS